MTEEARKKSKIMKLKELTIWQAKDICKKRNTCKNCPIAIENECLLNYLEAQQKVLRHLEKEIDI